MPPAASTARTDAIPAVDETDRQLPRPLALRKRGEV
jgi:hypothetical protein